MIFRGRLLLFVGFAFAVMADPVSSVAYAIEAALRALHGDLTLLLPTMALVIALVAIVVVNYQQIVARFPRGGGAAAATSLAFGQGVAFVPLGALIVDFVLTIAISVAAAASAIIASAPSLPPGRLAIAVVLVVGVAGLSYFGHGGRLIFATMTLAFIAVSAVVIVMSLATTPAAGMTTPSVPGQPTDPARIAAIILAFPVAMALATGVEAPASAIAQLGQLDDDGRRGFGRWTLWATLAVVGTLTLGLTIAVVRLGIGIPPSDSTELAELARRASPAPVFVVFQISSAVLLLAAASSSFQAGPGLLKALARDGAAGILPARFGVTNRHHTPIWGVVACLLAAIIVLGLAGAHDQELVLFYAVAVFMSFLAGLSAMAKIHAAEGLLRRLALDVVGIGVVAFTLLANLARGWPLLSLAAALAIAGGLHRLWVNAGRPVGSAAGGETIPE